MLLREIKSIFHNELDLLYGKEEVGSFFYLLIEHHFDLERFALALEPDLTISKEQESLLFEALSRLRLQEPIQHIIGKTHFMDLEFHVNRNVLIPRPETEELVRWVLSDIKDKRSECRVLDIGTGSGCIAISLAKNLPAANVYALDVSEEALAVARKNAKLNEVVLTFVKEDILETESLDAQFDIIVSNPPYIRDLEKKEMRRNVLEHEPPSALFVSNENPLQFYKRITKLAVKSLYEGGKLFFELNQYLRKEAEQLLIDSNFSEIEARKDMFGNDRMLKGLWNQRSEE